MIRILFFHNTIAEYRYPFFKELSKISNLKICLTEEALSEKVYKTRLDADKRATLNIVSAPKKNYRKWIHLLLDGDEFDLVILPTIDTYRDLCISREICRLIDSQKTKVGYFWEKWIPEYNVTPIKKQIKNRIQILSAQSVLRHVDYCYYPGVKTYNFFINQIGIPKSKLYKIHDCSEMPIDESGISIRKKYNISQEKILILYFGRLIERKGLGVLLNAFFGLDDHYYLLIAGGGDELAKYENQAKTLKLKNYVFVGEVNPKDRFMFFRDCDVFVLPSINDDGVIEAWGLTLNEAVQCEKFIISTDAVGSAYDLINKNGLRIKNNDVQALNTALRTAGVSCHAPEVSIASKAIKKEYSYKNMAADILKPFNDSEELDA